MKDDHPWKLDQADFSLLRDLIAREAGIRLSDFKKAFLISRLSPRLQELGLVRFQDYLPRLHHPTQGKEEIGVLINRITTNETRFFREGHHFEYLRHSYLPSLPLDNGPPVLSFWSAGCATGEEAYSLAMTLDDYPFPPGSKWRILATDIDSQALGQAQVGLFPAARARQIPPRLLKRYCLKGVGKQSSWIKIRPTLRRRVFFQYFNLHQPGFLPFSPFDGIFCRNVLIYFFPEAREKVIDLFHRFLKSGGLLFLGHSEILFGREDQFQALGQTIYQKK